MHSQRTAAVLKWWLYFMAVLRCTFCARDLQEGPGLSSFWTDGGHAAGPWAKQPALRLSLAFKHNQPTCVSEWGEGTPDGLSLWGAAAKPQVSQLKRIKREWTDLTRLANILFILHPPCLAPPSQGSPSLGPPSCSARAPPSAPTLDQHGEAGDHGPEAGPVRPDGRRGRACPESGPAGHEAAEEGGGEAEVSLFFLVFFTIYFTSLRPLPADVSTRQHLLEISSLEV